VPPSDPPSTVATVAPQGDSDAAIDELLGSYAASRTVKLRDEIVAQTRWLAVRGARRFADRGEPLDDLIQVAGIGLLKAIDRYDPAHGVPFGAYATPTIMGELRRHFRDHTWSVHVPRRAKDLRGAVTEVTATLNHELGRSPTVAELAEALHIDEDAVIEAMEAGNAYRTAPLEVTESAPPLADTDFDDVLDREVIAGLLDRLQPRQRTILYLRFFEELSQVQIAERIGTSQVHVGRLITSSLAELRRHLSAP
jgi:RNA polymerase sigma-B factor